VKWGCEGSGAGVERMVSGSGFLARKSLRLNHCA